VTDHDYILRLYAIVTEAHKRLLGHSLEDADYVRDMLDALAADAKRERIQREELLGRRL